MTDPSDAFAKWLDAVASGDVKMSQRQVTWAETHGGLKSLVAAAQARGVHLVQLTDDKGKRLLAASRAPFTTLC